MKRFFILLAAVLSTAVSCTTMRYVPVQADLQSQWIGATHAEIVRTYGAPNRECSDGAGGYILIYESFRTVYDTWMDGSLNYAREQRDFKEFYMDEKGLCYDVRSNERMAAGRMINRLTTTWLVGSSLLCLLPVVLFAASTSDMPMPSYF